MDQTEAAAVFAKKSGYSIEQLLQVCDSVLEGYEDNKEQFQWVHRIEPGRMMDALRLAIILTPNARELLGPLVYRTERTTLFTRWLKVSLNKNLKSVTSRTFQSGNIIGFGGRSLEEVVSTLGSMDVKEANQLSSELIRALIMKYTTNTEISDTFFNYLFSTAAKQLPNKLQRARQTLENKETAHIIFRALHECATTVHGRPLMNPSAAAYLKIFHEVCPLQNHDKDGGGSGSPDNAAPKAAKKRKRVVGKQQDEMVYGDMPENSIMLDDGASGILQAALSHSSTAPLISDDAAPFPTDMDNKRGATNSRVSRKQNQTYAV
jgi:hypothetical protein